MTRLYCALLALSVMLLLHPAARAQDVFSSGSYDTSPCNDARTIAAREQRENSQAFYEPPQPDGSSPLGLAVTMMSQEPGGSYGTGACHGAPGIIYFVPKDRVPEVMRLIGQLEASGPGGGNQVPTGRSGPPLASNVTGGGPGYVPGGGGQPTPAPLAGGVSNDPCHPYYNLSTAAGQAAMRRNQAADLQRCNERRCQDNPQLEVCKGGPAVASIQRNPTPPVAAQCAVQATSHWSTQQAKQLQQSLMDARTMLLKARAHVVSWDTNTAFLSQWWFGNFDKATQATMLARIDGMLGYLQHMTASANLLPPDKGINTTDKNAYMWTKDRNLASPPIHINPEFFNLPATGSDSMAATIVHELSHFTDGGTTDDTKYGEGKCEYLAFVDSAGVAGDNAMSAIRGVLQPNKNMPQPPPNTRSMNNAASFSYFIYYASSE